MSATSVKRLLVALSLVLLATVAAGAQGDAARQVILEGQFVCSECWFEADRNTTTYGTPADIQCAQECAEKGIPPAVAVKSGNKFKLYLIDKDRFKSNTGDWMGYIGKWIRVSGELETKKNRDYIVVKELTIRPEPTLDQGPSVIGLEQELTLKDLFGVEQKLTSYRGRIIVLNFWATWCVPCRKEMPDLAAIQNEYAALGVQVIGAAADNLPDRSKVIQFVRDTHVNFPVWLGATTEDMKRFGLGPALPATAVIGRDGRILSLKNGVITQADLKKYIESLLASDARTLGTEIASNDRMDSEASLVPS